MVRDFQGYQNGTPPTGHPDFGHYCCDDSLKRTSGMLRTTLGGDRKPVWAGPDPVADPTQTLFTGKAAFDQWYHDTSGVNLTLNLALTLLENATNHAPEGSRIVMESRREGDRLWLSVIDEGPGIPPSDLSRIFERFYRVDKSRTREGRDPGGTGLGLSIVRHLVELHGGQIFVESQPGKGTRTSFNLPALDD